MLLVVVVGAAIGAACTGAPNYREPETIGVIVEVDPVPGGTTMLPLTSGEIITVNEPEGIDGVPPGPGSLLLYGVDGDEPWYLALRPQRDDCFLLGSRASDAGQFLDFDVGIRLPKASDFSLLPTVEGRYGDALSPLCIDREGKVRGYHEARQITPQARDRRHG